MMNSIYLRRRLKIHVNAGDAKVPSPHIASLQKNIEPLGFVLSQTLMDRVQTLPQDRLTTLYKNLVKYLREMVGAHRAFSPMYPNFPEQVMEAPEATLYLNAIIHYLTNQLPKYDKQERPNLTERPPLRVIDLGSREDFESVFTLLAAAKTSLSAQDKFDVAWFVAQYRDDIARLIPPVISLKENVAMIGAQLIRHTSLARTLLADRIKTATDVLRLAVALSDGDVSLAEPTKFAKFRRSERKQLLSLLENSGDPTEDMLRWKERWKRLGERLHPGDFSDTFPRTAAAFSVLRNDKPVPTFNRQLEGHLRRSQTTAALALLLQRPGDLARRLDHLLRLDGDPSAVMQTFEGITDRISTPVLLQVMTHFAHRARPGELRIFFPKGDVAKVYATPSSMPPLPDGIAGRSAEICERTILHRFAALPPLGTCYLDPSLKNYLVPFSQRSASKSLHTLVRGSRIQLQDSNIVRFFLWWKNGSSRTDIDLSAALFDGDCKYVDVLSYYNLKNFGGAHSGDIVDAPNGAAEFIDLDIARTKAARVRFVVMSLNSFTEQPYCDLPECFAGWMTRIQAGSGEIFEPRTVQDKIDVAANTRTCIPAILDLDRREVIWTDIALHGHPRWNNVKNNLSGIALMLRAMIGLVKTDLHTLFSLHIRARGTFIQDPTTADNVFSVHAGVTPFHLDQIAAEYL